MAHDQAKELPVISLDGDKPLLAVCCNKCRTVRFITDAQSAVTQMMEHVIVCKSNGMVIAELLKPGDGT